MRKILHRILIVVLIVIGLILITIFWMDRKISKNSYPPELFEFNPVDFNASSDKPIYYYSDNKLYYDSLGEINLLKQPIWKGEIADSYDRHIFVSPNADFIAINVADSKILILDKSGAVLHEIAPINESFVEEDRYSGNYWGEELVWNQSSTNLYFMQDKKWVSNFSDDNRTSLFSYSILDDKVYKVVDLKIECKGTFHISHNENIMYFEFADDDGELPYKKLDLSSNNEMGDFYRNENHKFEISSDSIFINYRVNQFGNFSHDYKHLITTVGGRNVDCGLYYYSDTLTKLLIKGKYGFGAFKGHHYSFLDNGEFLPGDRFYIGRLRTDKYNGTLIVDVKTKKYEYIDKKIECFFSITNIDQPDFQRREYETSKQLEMEKLK